MLEDFQAPRLGRMYWLPAYWNWLGLSNGSQPGVIGRVFVTPIYFPDNMVISQISMNMNTAGGALSTIRLGLYRDNGNTPVGGALVVDSGDLGANVSVPIAFTFPTPIFARKGISLWAALETSNAVMNFARAIGTSFFVDLAGENIISGYYDRGGGYGALTDPCPALTGSNLTRFMCFVRVDRDLGLGKE